jgi:hypothetical protein
MTGRLRDVSRVVVVTSNSLSQAATLDLKITYLLHVVTHRQERNAGARVLRPAARQNGE